MINARVNVPLPINEPILGYAPGSPEKAALKTQLERCTTEVIEIPLVIAGRDVSTGDLGQCVLPHDHAKVVATYHKGNAGSVSDAIDAAAAARPAWAAMPWEARAAIFLKAADLLAGRYRQVVGSSVP